MKKLLKVVILVALTCPLLHYFGYLPSSDAEPVIKVYSLSGEVLPDYLVGRKVQGNTYSPSENPVDKVYRSVKPEVPSPAPTPVPVPNPEPQTPAPAPQPQPETPAPAQAPTPEPAPVPEPSDNLSAMQNEMLGYINAARAQNNLAPLTLGDALCNGAYLKAKDMAENNYFSHTSPTYGSPFDMMKSLGISYQTAGENIAKNTSIKSAHDAFMNSDRHRQNILGSSYSKVGLGFYQEGHYLYVTQWFTN